MMGATLSLNRSLMRPASRAPTSGWVRISRCSAAVRADGFCQMLSGMVALPMSWSKAANPRASSWSGSVTPISSASQREHVLTPRMCRLDVSSSNSSAIVASVSARLTFIWLISATCSSVAFWRSISCLLNWCRARTSGAKTTITRRAPAGPADARLMASTSEMDALLTKIPARFLYRSTQCLNGERPCDVDRTMAFRPLFIRKYAAPMASVGSATVSMWTAVPYRGPTLDRRAKTCEATHIDSTGSPSPNAAC